MGSKNIVSKTYKVKNTTKNVISNISKEEQKADKIIESPVAIVSNKTITTENVNSLLKNSKTEYAGEFSNNKKLAKIFTDAKIYDDNSIPSSEDELLKIKGIGKAIVKKIMSKK